MTQGRERRKRGGAGGCVCERERELGKGCQSPYIVGEGNKEGREKRRERRGGGMGCVGGEGWRWQCVVGEGRQWGVGGKERQVAAAIGKGEEGIKERDTIRGDDRRRVNRQWGEVAVIAAGHNLVFPTKK